MLLYAALQLQQQRQHYLVQLCSLACLPNSCCRCRQLGRWCGELLLLLLLLLLWWWQQPQAALQPIEASSISPPQLWTYLSLDQAGRKGSHNSNAPAHWSTLH